MTSQIPPSLRVEEDMALQGGILHSFFEEGTVEAFGGNTPFLLNDPQSVWMVAAGLVDIFFVHVENGRPDGPRYHCTTIHPGEIFFMPVSPDEFGLLAVSAGESRLRRADLTRFPALAQRPENRPEIARLLDLWISGLVEGAVSDEIKFTDLEVEPGLEQIIDSDLSVRSRGPVVWLQMPADRGVYMDRRILGVDGEPVWVPVSGRGWVWIQGTESFTLRTLATEALLALPDFRHWLEEFCAIFLACAQQRVVVFDADEKERLEQLEKNNRLARQEAIECMHNVLTGGDAGLPAREALQEDILAACSMVGRALGIVIKAPVEHAFTGSPGPAQVEQIAHASGIRVRRTFLKDKWWRRDHGPLLAFLAESGRPVALIPSSPSRYRMYDPQTRATVEVGAALAASLDPGAYVFYRSLPGHAAAVRELLAFGLHGCKRDIVVLGLMGVLGALLGLVPPLLTGHIFDTVIPQVERSILFQIAGGLAAIAVGTVSFEVTKVLALLRISTKANHSLECGMWDRLLKLPVDFFRGYLAGDLAMRANGFTQICAMVKGTAVVAVLSAIFSTFDLILMFYYSTKLTMVGLAMIALAVLFVCLACRSMFGSFRRVYTLSGELSGLVFQLMTGIGKLRSAGAEVRAFARWARLFSEQMHAQYSSRLSGIAQAVFSSAYPSLCTLVLFLTLGLFMKGDESMSIGSFLAFNTAFGSFLSAILAMSMSLIGLVGIGLIWERAAPILETRPEVDESRLYPGRLNGRIEVNQVSFRYDRQGPFILENVSMQVQPGRFVALVGPSGSGKSTLLRLLLGFETPELGSIYYDGQEFSRLDSQSVRRQIGVVLQNAGILPGSIFQNIVGSAPLSLEDAWRAARLAGIEQDILEMPMQMHTLIMEGAGGFSGGQKQRLMIARAVAGNPRILFFDEATSALDNQTQDAVSKSIESLRATRIVIAHRLSTIIHADRIIVMNKGRVVQEGTYEELMAREGPFKDLVTRQIV